MLGKNYERKLLLTNIAGNTTNKLSSRVVRNFNLHNKQEIFSYYTCEFNPNTLLQFILMIRNPRQLSN